MRLAVSTVALAVASASIASAARADEAACQALAEPGLFADTTVTSAAVVAATAGLPAYCEVAATVSAGEGSSIGMVYRLPETWNGKVLGLGGGGFAGNTSLPTAAQGLSHGYATMQTDTGHPLPDSPMGVMDASWTTSESGEPNWARLEDFGHRAIHLMTDVGKAVAAAYYDRAHERAYYVGCSTGGRQGMMETQRYPEDYDGVVAGAPVYDVTVQSSGVLRGQLFSAVPARRMTPAQVAALSAAAIAACDPLDGLTDGIVGDEKVCTFDPHALVCAYGSDETTCLTPDQADAAQRLYRGVTLDDGRVAAWPMLPGSEPSWIFATGGPGDPVMGQPVGAALFFGDAAFDQNTATPQQVLDQLRNAPFTAMYEANDPDLSAFVGAGGKLILHHGAHDSLANPLAAVDYYERVVATMGEDARDSVRMFLMPGTGHCGGGPGANSADWLAAIEAWVETGVAPDSIPGRRTAGFGSPLPADAPELTRPLCAYPALARHQGGDPNAAESFICQ